MSDTKWVIVALSFSAVTFGVGFLLGNVFGYWRAMFKERP